jgi:hypothetical protein
MNRSSQALSFAFHVNVLPVTPPRKRIRTQDAITPIKAKHSASKDLVKTMESPSWPFQKSQRPKNGEPETPVKTKIDSPPPTVTPF